MACFLHDSSFLTTFFFPFNVQIRQIVEKMDMPTSEDGRQTFMFSATFPKEIQRL